jgi:hypothetical protein
MRKLWPHLAAEPAVDQVVSALVPAISAETRLAIWTALLLLPLLILWDPLSRCREMFAAVTDPCGD